MEIIPVGKDLGWAAPSESPPNGGDKIDPPSHVLLI